MKKTYYSNGKLLITGEYLVLDGANAFALPTKFGQNLTIEPSNDRSIFWTSFDADGTIWFEDTISISDIINKSIESDNSVKNTLINILHEGYQLITDKALFFKTGYTVETKLTFPRNWGLGTSSTLINNIANWMEIDAFKLLRNSFGGSGYDIACAKNDKAIRYQIINQQPHTTSIDFNPKWKDKLYFVYLNQKQNSNKSIGNYRERFFKIDEKLIEIDNLTEIIISTQKEEEFAMALEKHEKILSEVLNQPTIKTQLFSDFKGTIKSLGAWGGDFVLVYSNDNPTNYFESKGYKTILTFSEMIK